MNVTLYGTRGSIAVANNDTKKHGGNTTCMYVETKTGVPIIIDAGTGIRKLGFDLLQKKKQHLNLIFTHYHWDHIQGFPFFAPLFFKNIKIDIYGSKKETTARKALNYQMNRPYFPATMDELFATISFKELKKKMRLGGVEIQYLPTNHPNYTLGLKFTEGNKRFVFLSKEPVCSILLCRSSDSSKILMNLSFSSKAIACSFTNFSNSAFFIFAIINLNEKCF